MDNKGMKANKNKTEVTISGESHKMVQNTEINPCDICGRGVSRNSI